MSIIDIINIVNTLLPEEIKDNISYQRIVSQFKSILDEVDIVNINVREDIIAKDSRLQTDPKIIPAKEGSPVLFSMLCNSCEFIIEVANIPMITFSLLTGEKDYMEDICIEITINEGRSNWKVVKTHTNRAGYCFDYYADLFCYNKDGDEIKVENKDYYLDDDFASFFGISIEDARECRLNFSQYADRLNEIKAQIYMDGVDEIESSVFLSPFKMDELGIILTGIEDSLEEDSDESDIDEDDYSYDDNDDEDDIDEYIDDNALETVFHIKDELVRVLGVEGDFTMNRSLFYNVTDYVNGRVLLLSTKGKFIRKLNGEYTIFYVSITDNSVICIPKSITSKEAIELYEKDEGNCCVEGLEEFFGISKKYNFKQKKNNLF